MNLLYAKRSMLPFPCFVVLLTILVASPLRDGQAQKPAPTERKYPMPAAPQNPFPQPQTPQYASPAAPQNSVPQPQTPQYALPAAPQSPFPPPTGPMPAVTQNPWSQPGVPPNQFAYQSVCLISSAGDGCYVVSSSPIPRGASCYCGQYTGFTQ
jgi:hypothetical protein